MSRGQLLELLAGLEAMQVKPERAYFRDFTIWPRYGLVDYHHQAANLHHSNLSSLTPSALISQALAIGKLIAITEGR